MGQLEGKVAIITGGARGQGASEGALFAAEGATVYLTDVLVDEGAKTAAEIGATFLPHDVTDPAGWASVVDRVLAETGRIDVLVNNAGILHWAPMTETPLDVWNRVIAVNQTGVFLGMQAVAPAMKVQRRGSIVNISSIGGMRGASPCFAYGATKWAVRGMTKGAAQELGPFNVRVNSVHPGIIDTPMMADKPIEAMAERVPLQRYASADEVAKLVLWLAGDDSSYATGAEFTLDGGQTA
jgi:3alpha(or 20beta)-hydroxysteroid dehydrogenase